MTHVSAAPLRPCNIAPMNAGIRQHLGRAAIISAVWLCALPRAPAMMQQSRGLTLPPPTLDSSHGLEKLLQRRRSVRDFSAGSLSLAQISQLLWAAQGVTSPDGLRTAPSAGALYPLEIYVVAGHVEGLQPGIYRYHPHGHRLTSVELGDKRRALADAALHQQWIAKAPVIVVFGADYSRTATKYGDRAQRYVDIETGHAAENIFLQAGSLGLATCDVGAFNDHDVKALLGFPHNIAPLLLMPVGVPR